MKLLEKNTWILLDISVTLFYIDNAYIFLS